MTEQEYIDASRTRDAQAAIRHQALVIADATTQLEIAKCRLGIALHEIEEQKKKIQKLDALNASGQDEINRLNKEGILLTEQLKASRQANAQLQAERKAKIQ